MPLDRITELERTLSALGPHDNLTREQAAHRAGLNDELRRLRIAQVRSIVDGNTSGSTESGVPMGQVSHQPAQVMFRGNPWTTTVSVREGENAARSLRGQAVTAVERTTRMSDAARQVATRALEADDDPDGELAKHTIASSDPTYFRAFRQWMNEPEMARDLWTPEERTAIRRTQEYTRAMNLGTAGAGGYLVPFELDPTMNIVNAGAIDPMRRVARVVQSGANEKRFITTAGVTASWDAEAAEVSDDSPTLANPSITTFKGAAYVQASYELDEDADLSRQVSALFADAKANLEATAFTTGTGSGQPKGVITAVSAVGGSVVNTASTNTLALGDLYALQAAVPTRWRQNSRFMANLTVINAMRQFAKGTGLTDSIVTEGSPYPTALSWPIVENSNMDGTLTPSVNDYIVLAGDFSQYAIVDRIGAVVVQVPVVIGANRRPTGERGWYLHWRTGGDVLTADAFRLLNANG